MIDIRNYIASRLGPCDPVVMLDESHEKWPSTRAMLHLYVDDADAVYRSALEAGARSLREPANTFYGDGSGGVDGLIITRVPILVAV